MCMLVAFLFIVYITDVIGLLLDFAALQFMFGLDNIDFFLVDNGYCILWMKYLTTNIKILSFREKNLTHIVVSHEQSFKILFL